MAQIVESNLDVVTSLDSNTDFIRCISNGGSRNITPKNLSKIIHEMIEITANGNTTISVATNTRGILFFSSATETSCGIYAYNVNSEDTISIYELVHGGSSSATINVTATSPQTDPISITVENNDSTVVSCFILRHE